MNPTIFGILVLAIPLLILGLLVFWKNYRTVFWVYVGAIAVILGYLATTGALNDIGKPVHDAVYGSSTGKPADAKKKEMKKEKKADEAPASQPAASDGGNSSSIGSPAGRYVDEPAGAN